VSCIKENKIADNILWNTVGSLFYLVCQWLLGVFVVRLSGSYGDAGILSLAMSIATFFSVITLFNVRNYQVSDSKGEYSSSDYVFHRIVTCVLSFVLCVIFVLINSYDLVTSLSVIAYMLVKLVEGFADVLHGEAQKKWRLDIAGKSFIMRGILLISSFSITVWLTKKLALAIFMMAIATLVPLIAYDFFAVRKVESFSLKQIDKKSLLSLSKTCLPMVIYGAAINAIVPFARYILEFYHGTESLGYYASVSTIAVLVQAFVTFVFTPLIGLFENAASIGNKKAMLTLLLKLVALLIGVTAVALVAIAFFGEFAMVLMFGEEIRAYVYLLYPTIIASCLTAFVWLMGMLLVVIRDSVTLLVGAVIGFALGVVIAFVMIPQNEYLGTNMSIIAAFALISLVYIVRFIIYFFKNKEGENNVGKR